MKKLFTTLALSGAFMAGASAQTSSDFETILTGMTDSIITCEGDSFQIAFTIVNHGPDALASGETLAVQGAWNDLGFANGYTLTETLAEGDSLFLSFTFANSDEVLSLYDPEDGVDSIVGAPFTVGKVYGMYVGVTAFGTSTYEDPTTDNNYSLAGVYWCSTEGTSASSLKGLDKQQIAVYPNPTQDNINFKYAFEKASGAVARVLDITGRVVMTRDFGKQAAGEQMFNMNVADLPAGTYTLEFVTDANRGISKFTVK